MGESCGLLIAAAFLFGLATAGGDEPRKPDPKPFRGRIVLIGARTADDPKATTIRTMAPGGTELRTLLRLTEGGLDDRLVTAWLPGDKQVASFRWHESANAGTGAAENRVIDVTTKKETKLALTDDYVAEDWRPKDAVRTVIYANPRNWIYRGDGG